MGILNFFRKKGVVDNRVEIGSFDEAVRVFEERVEILKKKERSSWSKPSIANDPIPQN